jgi:hypothetical protein
VFGWSWGGWRWAGHGALLLAAAAGGDGGAPVVVSDGEGIGELHCAMGKLTAGLIGAEEGRLGVFHGEQGVAAVGLGHSGDVSACWGLKRLGEVVQELPRDDVVLLE